MKKQKNKKIVIILLLMLQFLQLIGSLIPVQANIKEGDTILLEGDHECDSLVEYWMEKEQKWSYKVVWYVYYYDKVENKKYPAFCVEPAKEGVGTGYTSYDTTIQKEEDNRIWRILNKGYMGSSYKDWKLECDDDLYTATKIALHCLQDGSVPNKKYILGTRSVDGNTVEEIQRRGKKALEVAQQLYEYGINGTETYVPGKVSIAKKENEKIETINNISYYIQNYEVTANKTLKSYDVAIQNFPKGTKILNSNNQEQANFTQNSFKIAIPMNQIKQDIKGSIEIKNAEVRTNPIFYCKSSIAKAQSYVTYMSGYEKTNTQTTLQIKANQCNLEIQKIEKETNKPIPNVTFAIEDEQHHKIAEVTTNENGIAKLENLNPQTVTIKEIKVPEPYILSNEEKEVKLEWGKVANVTFENERKKGNLKILKVDADNHELPLENVEFALYDSKGNLVKKLITNSKGEAYIENLEIGTYILKETKTNENYVLTEEEIKVEIQYAKATILQLENEKIQGQIKIVKVSQDDNLRNEKPKASPISNVVFEIRNEEGKIVETLTTNQEGIALSSKLPKGMYTIKEIKTDEDYLLTEEEFTIEIKEHERIEEIIITNLSKEPEKPKLPRTGF